MSASLPEIIYPELFFGFVAPVGAEIKSSVKIFKDFFAQAGYNVIEIKVTDIFGILSKYVEPSVKLVRAAEYERYTTYIKYGDQIREHFSDDAILSATAIARVVKRRVRLQSLLPSIIFSRTVYLIHQFKRKEEINLLRSMYGNLFFQVSIYSRREARVDALSRIFAHSESVFSYQKYRNKAENIIQIDENDTSNKHGQRVAQIFHEADFIINLDVETTVEMQVLRYCELLFGSNKISPNRFEYGMFLAKATALRSLDVSRQVGAAIFSESGEILSLGSNEVPKAGGGTYWCDERFDDRDYVRGEDPNERRKRDNLKELFKRIGTEPDKIEELLASDEVRDSQIMDALEYGRVIHAEMSALTDAARLGISIKGAILYCTTFPCHMCAKHLVAAGLSRIVFLEPYPKSLASDLHADSIRVESGDRGKYQNYPFVHFEHFYGITPRRYREMFENRRRKKDGKFQEYANGVKKPIVSSFGPIYNQNETLVIHELEEIISNAISEVDKNGEA
jgi:deoxycytidylate deaminase